MAKWVSNTHTFCEECSSNRVKVYVPNSEMKNHKHSPKNKK